MVQDLCRSACLPPVWPGFDAGLLPCVGVVCCWLSLGSEGFPSGSHVFLTP